MCIRSPHLIRYHFAIFVFIMQLTPPCRFTSAYRAVALASTIRAWKCLELVMHGHGCWVGKFYVWCAEYAFGGHPHDHSGVFSCKPYHRYEKFCMSSCEMSVGLWPSVASLIACWKPA